LIQYEEKINSLSSELKSFDIEVQKLIWDETDESNESKIEEELDSCNSYEEKVLDSISKIKSKLRIDSYPRENQRNNLKPPDVPLPTFSGKKGESLQKYFEDFEAIIDKFNYSSYEKFVILKGQLSNRALIIILSLEKNKQSYEEAKSLLTQAFASTLQQQFDAIEELLNLNFPYTKDPYIFISEIRVIIESFKNLKIEINHVLQFFIWKAMNDVLQNQFIQITNKNKPSLSEIQENLFMAVERYSEVTQRYEERKNARKRYQPPSQKKPYDQQENSKTVSKYPKFCFKC